MLCTNKNGTKVLKKFSLATTKEQNHRTEVLTAAHVPFSQLIRKMKDGTECGKWTRTLQIPCNAVALQ